MIGFIGTGQMARALATGFVLQGNLLGEEICFTNPGDANAEAFERAAPGARRLNSAADVAREAAQVWIAVKPQIIRSVLEPLKGSFRSEQVLVSVAAGVTLSSLTTWTRHERIIRVSPNTPAIVGQGISILSKSPSVSEVEAEHVCSLLRTVGSAREVPERLIDPISGLTSCGPAFVMTILEALADGAVRAGVPRDLANPLALELLAGSTAMAQDSSLHPAQLREQVASPAGSTIEGLAALEQGGLRAALMNAVVSSAKRAQELGRLAVSSEPNGT
ncbi:MAG: pyrroline-5-carboxylate reductase [Planctomycetaceae bacterium]|nr:pyrroline-5-carboxylate reductase [Planctomycetaceae bacterium]